MNTVQKYLFINNEINVATCVCHKICKKEKSCSALVDVYLSLICLVIQQIIIIIIIIIVIMIL